MYFLMHKLKLTKLNKLFLVNKELWTISIEIKKQSYEMFFENSYAVIYLENIVKITSFASFALKIYLI